MKSYFYILGNGKLIPMNFRGRSRCRSSLEEPNKKEDNLVLKYGSKPAGTI